MYICSNTFFVNSDTGVPFVFTDFVYSILIFLPCFFLSFGTDWWCAANLHNITQVPGTLMISTLFQVATNFAVWGISFSEFHTAVLWSIGLALEVVGLVAWISVQQHRYERDNA